MAMGPEMRRGRRGAKKRAMQRGEAAAEPTRGAEIAVTPTRVAGGLSGMGILVGIRERDIVIFLRQLIMLLEAGTPLLKALTTLSERSERGALRGLVGDMKRYVEMGNPLWQAFERHPRYFDTVFVNLVKAAEASGTLGTVLERLCQYRERRQMLLRRVKSAMVYPGIVLVACLAVVFIIGKFVLPQLKDVFDRLEQTMPPFTQFFMGFVDALARGWLVFWVALILVVLYALYRFVISRNPLYRLRADWLKLKVPYVGPNIVRKNAIVEMTRTLSLLLGSGLSMMTTLELTRNAIRNRAVAHILESVQSAVEQGAGIEQALREAPRIVPPVVTDMLVTGEESGQLDKISGQIAETYEEEVRIHINTLADLMPPVLAVIMGGFVAALALSVFIPLISMIDQLQSTT